MSSYDLESALAQANTTNIFKERIRRQLGEYCLGVNRVFTSDPATEWDPQWIVDNLKGFTDPKAEKTALGSAKNFGVRALSDDEVTYIQDVAVRKGVKAPKDEAVMQVLERMGYGTIWPHLPTRPGIPHDELTEAERVGIVGKQEYKEIMQSMSKFVFDKFIRFRHLMKHHHKEMSEFIEELSPLDTVPQPRQEDQSEEVVGTQAPKTAEDTEMQDTATKTQPTTEIHAAPESLESAPEESVSSEDETNSIPAGEEALEDIISTCWTETAKEIREAFHLQGTRMDISPDDPPCAYHEDSDWVQRHMKNAQLHEDGGYLVPWVDFDPSCKGTERKKARYEQATQQIRGICLAPDLSTAFLGRSNNLLFLLYNRCWLHPAAYFNLDYKASHVGRAARILNGLFAKGVTVSMDPYAQLNKSHLDYANYIDYHDAFPNVEAIWYTNGHMQNANVDEDWQSFRDEWHNGRVYGSGEAQIALLTQCLIYGFLEKLCTTLVQDFLDVEPASSLPSNKQEDNAPLTPWEYHDYQVAQVFLRPEVMFLQITEFGPSMHDYAYLMAANKARQKGKEVSSRFESANAFWDEVSVELDHHYGNLPVGPGVQPLPHFSVGASKAHRYDLYYDVVGKVVRRALIESTIWHEMDGLVKKIRECAPQSEEIKKESQGETQRREATCGILMTSLGSWAREAFLYYLAELLRRGIFVASPSMRRFFQRITDTKELVSESYYLKKTLRDFPLMQVEPTAEEPTMQECLAINLIHEILGNPVAVNVLSMRKILSTIGILFDHQMTDSPLTPLVKGTLVEMEHLTALATIADRQKIVSMNAEISGLFRITDGMRYHKAQRYDCGPGLQGNRKRWMWWSPSLEAGQGTVLALEDLDNFVYEEWEKVPAKHYLRLYSWIHEKASGVEPSHTDEEVLVQLRKFLNHVLTEIKSREMKSMVKACLKDQTLAVALDPAQGVGGVEGLALALNAIEDGTEVDLTFNKMSGAKGVDFDNLPKVVPLITDAASGRMQRATIGSNYEPESSPEADDFWVVEAPRPLQRPADPSQKAKKKRQRQKQKLREKQKQKRAAAAEAATEANEAASEAVDFPGQTQNQMQSAANPITSLTTEMQSTSLQEGSEDKSKTNASTEGPSSSDAARASGPDAEGDIEMPSVGDADDVDVEMTSDGAEEHFDVEQEREIQRQARAQHSGTVRRLGPLTLQISGPPAAERRRRSAERQATLQKSRERHSPEVQGANSAQTSQEMTAGRSGQQQTAAPSQPDIRNPLTGQDWNTLEIVFKEKPGTLHWREFSAMVTHLGYELKQGDGSAIKLIWTDACPWPSTTSMFTHPPHGNGALSPANLKNYKFNFEAAGINMALIRKHFRER